MNPISTIDKELGKMSVDLRNPETTPVWRKVILGRIDTLLDLRLQKMTATTSRRFR